MTTTKIESEFFPTVDAAIQAREAMYNDLRSRPYDMDAYDRAGRRRFAVRFSSRDEALAAAVAQRGQNANIAFVFGDGPRDGFYPTHGEKGGYFRSGGAYEGHLEWVPGALTSIGAVTIGVPAETAASEPPTAGEQESHLEWRRSIYGV